MNYTIHPQARVGGCPEARDWLNDPSKESYHPVVEPSALVNAFVSVDSGCERPTYVGHRTILMQHVHIGHDAIIGDDCELAPGTVVGGYAEIGNGVKIGMNATIRNRVEIGDGARIGMGSVVLTDVPPGEVWVGNPARPIKD